MCYEANAADAGDKNRKQDEEFSKNTYYILCFLYIYNTKMFFFRMKLFYLFKLKMFQCAVFARCKLHLF